MIEWSEEKNRQLIQERDICFEEVLEAIEDGRILADLIHPNSEKYPSQRVLVVEIQRYAFLVPYVQKGEIIFLKTILPSRKYTKKFLLSEL